MENFRGYFGCQVLFPSTVFNFIGGEEINPITITEGIMRTQNVLAILLLMAITVGFNSGIAQAELLKICVTMDQQGMEGQYSPLVTYLATKGIDVKFIPARNYQKAALMFAEAKVDGIFSGSGIAGIMIMKKIATPVLRPLAADGTSTYWAFILGPKGSKKFSGEANYFSGKKVSLCALASAGEIYFHAIGGDKVGATVVQTPSHGTAIYALANGRVDFAIVKNRVWNELQSKYPDLEVVGVDTGENPNETFLISKIAKPAFAKKVTTALLGLLEDSSAEARNVKSKMGILGYIKTTEDDFAHTLSLLEKSGVTPSFNFEFR